MIPTSRVPSRALPRIRSLRDVRGQGCSVIIEFPSIVNYMIISCIIAQTRGAAGATRPTKARTSCDLSSPTLPSDVRNALDLRRGV